MQQFITLGVLLLINTNMFACNICGCNVSGANPGVLPQFNSHFIGIRSTNKTYHSKHLGSIINPGETHSTDRYLSTELWARFYPIKRIQVYFSLPYNQFYRNENGIEKTKTGWGDLSTLFNYLIIKTADTTGAKFKQVLSIGASVKLKTGRFEKNDVDGAYFQMGSGSYAYTFYTSYVFNYKQMGLMNEVSQTRFGLNPMNYQIGNRINVSSRVYQVIELNSVRLMPRLGYLYEKSAIDKQNNIVQDHTGSFSHHLEIGADAYYKQFSLGCYLQKPVYQNLNQGYTVSKPFIQLQLIYNLNKKSCSTK
jgi:hypothetical protein